MLGALIIVLREVIEAGLIVGIVMAVTRRVPFRWRYIGGGILAGIFGAALTASFAGALSAALAGRGQEIFNASVLGLAVIFLGWHNIWMARHGPQMSEELRQLGRDVASGSRSLAALAAVIAVAVLREGAEVVLFLYGIVISSKDSTIELLAGGVTGLLLGVGISGLAYAGLSIIPGRYFFKVTSILIAFIAAGMAAQSVAYLEQADLVNTWGSIAWNTSHILPDNGVGGRLLHTLIGYTDRPTGLQLAAYLATLAAIFGLMRMAAPATKPHPSAFPVGEHKA